MNTELALASSNIPLRWGNVFTTLLIPQRSMLFGLPFVAMIIALWWMAFEERDDGATGRRGDKETKRQGEGVTYFPLHQVAVICSPPGFSPACCRCCTRTVFFR